MGGQLLRNEGLIWMGDYGLYLFDWQWSEGASANSNSISIVLLLTSSHFRCTVIYLYEKLVGKLIEALIATAAVEDTRATTIIKVIAPELNNG